MQILKRRSFSDALPPLSPPLTTCRHPPWLEQPLSLCLCAGGGGEENESNAEQYRSMNLSGNPLLSWPLILPSISVVGKKEERIIYEVRGQQNEPDLVSFQTESEAYRILLAWREVNTRKRRILFLDFLAMRKCLALLQRGSSIPTAN